MLRGNIGEWSELYIFLSILLEGRLYAADSNFNKLGDVYLKVVKIIREETPGCTVEYLPGENIRLLVNGKPSNIDVAVDDLREARGEIWALLTSGQKGSLTSPEVEAVVNKIYIEKLSAPARQASRSFGGTQDIVLTVLDYRSGITTTIGFSCKSTVGSSATLFNASGDNTNFSFCVCGGMTDDIMDEFNNLRDNRGRVPIQKRLDILRRHDFDLVFKGLIKEEATRNLTLSGGKEMPLLVASMLKNYYWENPGSSESETIEGSILWLAQCDPVNYDFNDLHSLYSRKVGDLLLDMFKGMRLHNKWDGTSEVSGGYIQLNPDGKVVAFHSVDADEFKSFLIKNVKFDKPSSSRHNAMSIYKIDGEYYLNLNLQIRFK